ncbi:MAG: hypothetical protein JW891_10920 [Candidatus Lokiarchaeota archaeon]|nr:hypothetical protein [Candidatus Lokiarchaeota archaeon]
MIILLITFSIFLSHRPDSIYKQSSVSDIDFGFLWIASIIYIICFCGILIGNSLTHNIIHKEFEENRIEICKKLIDPQNLKKENGKKKDRISTERFHYDKEKLKKKGV